nr:hypothetical protein CFP56_79352 [Quercus suber]
MQFEGTPTPRDVRVQARCSQQVHGIDSTSAESTGKIAALPAAACGERHREAAQQDVYACRSEYLRESLMQKNLVNRALREVVYSSPSAMPRPGSPSRNAAVSTSTLHKVLANPTMLLIASRFSSGTALLSVKLAQCVAPILTCPTALTPALMSLRQ